MDHNPNYFNMKNVSWYLEILKTIMLLLKPFRVVVPSSITLGLFVNSQQMG